MKVRPKAIIGIFVGWCLIIFFVALLTVIFSFLGTLICAGLAGMMMGAARLPRWQSLALSLIFPGVLFGTLTATRAQLEGKQMGLLALLCFGLFWVIYLAIGALVSGERTAAARQDTGSRSMSTVRPQTEALTECRGQVLPRNGEAMPELVPLTAGESCGGILDELQGTWVPESAKVDGGARRKVLQITEEKLLLTLWNGNGEVHLLARAEVKVPSGRVLNLQAVNSAPEAAKRSV